MTPEQYEHWQDFSYRMVNVVLSAKRKKPSRSMLIENIDHFFECRMEPDEWQRVRDWDHTEPSERERSRWPYSCMSVSGHLSDLAECFIPNYWSLPCEDEKPGVYQAAAERYLTPVQICIRAGLDVAVSPSAGVVGYTAGDIRKMYPEGIPDWVSAFLGPGESIALHSTNVEGIYVPENKGFDSRTFDQIPDSEPIWL